MLDYLGKKKCKRKEGLSARAWALIIDRKQLKSKINQVKGQHGKTNLQPQYWTKHMKVTRSAREDNGQQTHGLTGEAGDAAEYEKTF